MRKKYIKNLKDMVLRVLREHPRSRDSDAWLTVKLWCLYYPQRIIRTKNEKGVDLPPTIKLDDILDLPKEDQVKRVRAIIQNEEGRYLPTSLEVAKQRKINEETWREYTQNPPLQ